MESPKHFSNEQLQDWKKFYEENGYLVIPDFASEKEVDTLHERADTLMEAFFNSEESEKCMSIFTTVNQTVDEYFIDSADKVRFFFEEGAISKETGKLLVPKEKSINKIGHALDEDPVFQKFSHSPKVVELLKGLGAKHPQIAQSMYICKQPKIGGVVSIHQDSTFVNTKPLTCFALWFAVEEVKKENGCLWVVPKSHTKGISCRWRRQANGSMIMNSPDEDEKANWTSLDSEFNFEKYPEKWEAVPVPKGALIVIHGSLVHMSQHNSSNLSRHAYTFHMIEASSTYSSENWLQLPKGKSFRSFQNWN